MDRDLGESLGHALGAAIAPAVGLLARLRRGRAFHPDGVVFTATVEPLTDSPAARALEGAALARFSGALFRGEGFDVLGCGLRLRRGEPSPALAPDDQDFLFATARSLLRGPLAKGRADDYQAHVYVSLGGYRDASLGALDVELHPEGPSPAGGDYHTPRSALLRASVANGNASFRIMALPARGAPVALARVVLRAPAPIDPRALYLSPFHAGRGFAPRGFLQALRFASYRASQAARARYETERR